MVSVGWLAQSTMTMSLNVDFISDPTKNSGVQNLAPSVGGLVWSILRFPQSRIDDSTRARLPDMVPPFMTKSRTLLEAVVMYQDAIVSLGQAAEIAGLPYDSMIEEMRRLGIPLRFGPSSVKEAEEEARQFLESFKQSSGS